MNKVSKDARRAIGPSKSWRVLRMVRDERRGWRDEVPTIFRSARAPLPAMSPITRTHWLCETRKKSKKSPVTCSAAWLYKLICKRRSDLLSPGRIPLPTGTCRAVGSVIGFNIEFTSLRPFSERCPFEPCLNCLSRNRHSLRHRHHSPRNWMRFPAETYPESS